MDDAIEKLREKRGEQSVKFADVADHLRDYLDRRPDDRPAVLRLAAFLADVEDRPHDHAEDPKRGLG